MKNTSKDKPLRKYRVKYELGDPDWGCMSQHESETMAVSAARARANILYRAASSDAIRIIEVKEIAD